MDRRCRRSGRLVVAAGVTSTLMGFALLSETFGDAQTAALESRRWDRMLEVGGAALAAVDRVSAEGRDAGGRAPVRRWVSQVDEPIVSTTDP